MSEEQSRKASLNPKIIEAAEKLDWTVKEYEDGTAEFSQYSPAGEDFSFTVNAENAAKEIYEYYDNFDVDDHIERSRGSSVNPSARRGRRGNLGNAQNIGGSSNVRRQKNHWRNRKGGTSE